MQYKGRTNKLNLDDASTVSASTVISLTICTGGNEACPSVTTGSSSVGEGAAAACCATAATVGKRLDRCASLATVTACKACGCLIDVAVVQCLKQMHAGAWLIDVVVC